MDTVAAELMEWGELSLEDLEFLDKVAGDLALRSAVDFELMEDAARGLTAGCHALARIGDKGGFRKLRGW